jgi:hypothetical protein
MRKSTTSLENIKKITAFLNAFNDFLNKQNGVIKTNEAICIQDLHKVPYSIMKVAKDLGYFEKIDTQKYQSNFVHFEPIHARTLIEAHRKHRAEKEKQRLEKIKSQNPIHETTLKTESKKAIEEKSATLTKVKVMPIESFVVKEKPEAKRVESKVNELRVFSLFWGLIKFNY